MVLINSKKWGKCYGLNYLRVCSFNSEQTPRSNAGGAGYGRQPLLLDSFGTTMFCYEFAHYTQIWHTGRPFFLLLFSLIFFSATVKLLRLHKHAPSKVHSGCDGWRKWVPCTLIVSMLAVACFGFYNTIVAVDSRRCLGSVYVSRTGDDKDHGTGNPR